MINNISVTELKIDQGLIRLLLQNPNSLDLEQDRLTLREIVDISIKYNIDILRLPETNIN